ncbi:MAG: glycosyltransferase family 39 protein, partial [Deltaproteobacteria bacterium]
MVEQKMRGFNKSIILGFSLMLLLMLVVHGKYYQRYFFIDDFWLLAFYRFGEDLWQWLSLPIGHFYRPVLVLLRLNYFFFGLNPLWYHLINFILHFVNITLVFSVIYLFSKNIERAFLAGVIFAVHPISTQTSALFCHQDNLFGVLFCLIAIWSWAKFRLNRENKFYFLALLFMTFSFLCKETMIVSPFLIIVYDQFYGKRLFRSVEGKFLDSVKLYIPLFFFLVLFLGWRWHVIGGLGGYEFQRISLSSFLPQMSYHLPRLFYYVFYKMIYSNYAIMDKWSDLIFSSFTLIFLLLLVTFFKDNRLPEIKTFSFGLIWIFISIIPLSTSSHLLFGENVMIAERYLYLPLIGFSIVLISLLGEDSGSGNRKLAKTVLLSLLIFLYVQISIKENIIW